jgi:plasmid maintenance system antidote protein VapI
MAKHSDTQEKLAEALSMQVSGINARINGKIEFRASEISKIVKRYGLTPDETTEIFFTVEAS